MATRTRRDVWKLTEIDPWEPTLLWYARAIKIMRARSIGDFSSLRYQAAIHDYVAGDDPLEDPGDQMPSTAEQQKYWRQCQHFSWFFLPWHRWYLLYFEEIVFKAIAQEAGAPAEWSLPFWDYSRDPQPDVRVIPPAFTSRAWPDGANDNPLYIGERWAGNDGKPVGAPRHVSVACLDEPQFETTPAELGFGGPRTGFNHDLVNDVGQLEATPHGSMHGQVGGFMGFFHTAGLDPLFWLHHANIDRLWEAWRRRDASHVDPPDNAWLTAVTFDFRDGSGAAVTRSSAEVVDTVALGYEYEGLPAAPAPSVIEEMVVMADERIPEMVGASESPTPLTTAPTTANVAVSAPTGPVLESAGAAAAAPKRVFIRIENVTGQGHPRSYSVFVNGVFAGIIPLFGVTEATRASDKHGGGGLQYRLDVTKAVEELSAQGQWDETNVRVTFVPDEESLSAEGAALESVEATAAPAQFQVGRVSVFVA